MTHNVTLYTKDYCPYCKRAKALLRAKGISFTDIEVADNSERLREMIQHSGGRRTVPQIFIGDHHIGGADDLIALDRQDKLDPLLAVPA